MMVKLKHDDGFTLIEMLLVLLIIGICIGLFPFLYHSDSVSLQLEVALIQERLLMAQIQAIQEKETVRIEFHDRYLQINEEQWPYPSQVHCYGNMISFNEQGNINHAQTITVCHRDSCKAIVLQLGSGRMYAR